MSSIFQQIDALSYKPVSLIEGDVPPVIDAEPVGGETGEERGEIHDEQKENIRQRHQLNVLLLFVFLASLLVPQAISRNASDTTADTSPIVHAYASTQNDLVMMQDTNSTNELAVNPLSIGDNNTTSQLQSLLGDSLVFVDIMQESGLASVLLHFFKTAIYLKETEGREMIAMDYLYHRYDRGSQGLMRGWFDPKFPIIDSRKSLAMILPYSNNFEFYYAKPNHRLKHCKDWSDGQVRLSCHYDYGKEVRDYYDMRHNPVAFYQPMVSWMCPHMQFNQQAAQQMDEFREQKGVPRFDESSGTTVTFHVRRTDKVRMGESVEHPGEEYVARLLEVAPNKTFDHCFIATDASAAVSEISSALQMREINCQIHYFASEAEVGKWETLQFFTEISYMINATYFVGTFDSNVGGMVGVLRGCRGDKPFETFGNSYGVDSDTWRLR